MTAVGLRWDPRGWAIRDLGGRTATYLLGWDVAAAALVGVVALTRPTGVHSRHALVDLAVLLVLAVGYDEVSRRVEDARLGVARGVHVNMRSVWSLAGALLLPLPLFAVLAAVTYAHASLTGTRRNARVAGHRSVFNAATMVLSGAAASLVREAVTRAGGSGPVHAVAVVVLATATYFVVNTSVVAGALAVRRGRLDVGDLGTRADNVLEVSTLGVGALAALAGTSFAVLLAVPVLYLVQRSALVDELESAATQDAKTGLLNAAAWRAAAEQEVVRARRAGRPLAVLVVDLDHFKTVNDTHGHLAGDAVLAGVAACLTATLRDHDLVGRFGGEEFVAVLPAVQLRDAAVTAERVRAAIAAHRHTVTSGGAALSVRVTASIGVAAAPAHGADVTAVLDAADAAMYLAKGGGRDRVVVHAGPEVAARWS